MVQERIAVVGLGYVGIPLAALLADKGFDVVGIDVSKERASKVNEGVLPLKGVEPGLSSMLTRGVRDRRLRATTDYAHLADRTAVFVCVDTPIDEHRRPDYSRLVQAVTDIGRNMRKGTLVVIESTIAPGTMLDLVAPALEKGSGLLRGKGFKLAHCPERVMPGRLLRNLREYDRVVGALDRRSAERAVAIYSTITKGELHTTDLTSAEVAKTAENAYRDVQIAFANEVALICEGLGCDAFEVRRLVNSCPFRDMHVPGAGVGGHCLPKDPWLLVHGAKGTYPRLIPAARAVNDSMPFHVLDLVEEALRRAHVKKKRAVVAVLGASFLQDSGDTRNSPTVPLLESLKGCVAELRLHDPFVDSLAGVEASDDPKDVLRGADLAVVMVAHEAYGKMTPATIKKLMRTPAVVDGRNVFSSDRMAKAGFVYLGVGKGLT
jgi:UDP-N-acetyl-D-mannosaminuronic acid dehydrogenase